MKRIVESLLLLLLLSVPIGVHCADAGPAIDIPALKEEVAAIRGLAYKADFASGSLTREELGKLLAGEIDRETPPEEFRFVEGTYRMLGLIPRDCDLRKTFLDLAGAQVGGIYFPNKKSLYYVTTFQGMALPILSHELTHALQDQHYDIEKRDKERKGNGDASLAYHAIVEGDAMEVMAEYAKRNPQAVRLDPDEALKMLLGSLEGMNAPEVLTGVMMMPYVQGQAFVGRMRRAGGWGRVNQALEIPPESTEQILHPEKYLKEVDRPRHVALPDFGSALGLGWKKLGEDTIGEWTVSVILRIMTGDAVKGIRAGAGWDGDRLALYEKEDAQVLFWGSVWDTEKDAEEFRRYLEEGLKQAVPASGRTAVRRWGAAVFAVAGQIPEETLASCLKLFEKTESLR